MLIRLLLPALAAMFLVAAPPASADDDQQELVDRAELAVRSLLANEDNAGFRDVVGRAQAVLVVPRLIKGGFFVGGEGGTGVLLRRQQDNSWSDPVFYVLGGASIGIQFGAQAQELLIAIMTDRGVNALIDRKVRIGGDAGLALGTIGQGAEAALAMDTQADMYALSNVTGLFGGAALEGSVVESRDSWNTAYYGPDFALRATLNRPGSRVGTGGLRQTLSVHASPAQ